MGRVRTRATAVTSGPAPPPRESKMQERFRSAETDDTRAELFAHLARADNWFDIYKTSELARRLVGGPLPRKSAALIRGQVTSACLVGEIYTALKSRLAFGSDSRSLSDPPCT